MDFVGNDGQSEPWKNFCVRANGRGYKEWSISLFSWVFCFFIGEEVMETAWGVKNFFGKNLLIIYLFCRTEKRLSVSHKMNDMRKL